MSNQPPQIDYGPVSWHRDRRIQRRIALGLMIFGGLVAGVLFGPTLLRHAQLLFLQHQCLTFQHPPNQIVHESGKKSVTASCWIDFYEVFSPPGTISNGTILVHRMQNTAGEQRLVALDYVKGVGFCSRVYLPGSPLRPVKQLSSKTEDIHVSHEYLKLLSKQDQTLRISAATMDPTDASHFTFNIWRGDLQIEVDGWLRLDDTVALNLRGVVNEASGTTQPTAPPPASRE